MLIVTVFVVLWLVDKLSFIRKADRKTCVKECLLAKSSLKHLKIVLCCLLKNFRVGLKFDKCAVAVAVADNVQVVYRHTPFKALRIDVAVLCYLNLKPLTKRVNNRRANAVKTARNLVARAAEFQGFSLFNLRSSLIFANLFAVVFGNCGNAF